MSELKPCPFCGDSDNQHVEELMNGVLTVLCGHQECCAQGPLASDRGASVTAWNTRTESPELSAMRAVVEAAGLAAETWGLCYGSVLNTPETNLMKALAEYEKVKSEKEMRCWSDTKTT